MSKIRSLPPTVLGQRLREARQAARMTQTVVANELDMGRTTLVAIEKGDRVVRSAELVKLAALYSVSVGMLLRKSVASFDVAPLFRRSRSARKNEELASRVVRRLRDQACLYVDLESRLAKPLAQPSLPQVIVNCAGDLSVQAEDIALEVRQRLGFGLGPIPDVIGATEIQFGMRVFIEELPSSISGAFAFAPEVGACVILNRLHPRERQNWTFAHELAHFLTERDRLDVAWTAGSGQDTHYLERFADLFAGSLLLPAVTVRRRFNEAKESEGRFSARQLIYLASGFRVSIEAFTRRLQQLDLVPDGTYEALNRRGLGQVVREVLGEPDQAGDKEIYLPRFSLLAIEAHQKELLTEGQLAEYLHLSRLETRRLVDAIHGYDELLG